MPIPEKVKERRKELVEKVCEAMEKGTAPWQKPWVDSSCPVNAVSGRRYNGINFFNLSICGMMADGGQDPRWCTFEQAQEKGWRIKKGSKGTHIEFWKLTPTPETDRDGKLVLDENGKIKMKDVPLVRNYVVFHASQIDGIEPYLPVKTDTGVSLEKAERILKESGADIRHGGNQAFYNPESDYIQVPDRGQFLSNEGYYATTLHELGHWTGHSSRLNRELTVEHTSKEYAREELIAEMTSVFVSSETGIPQTEEHFQRQAGYIQSWIKILKEEPNALFRAASAASKASEEILKHERVREQVQEHDVSEHVDFEKLDDRERVAFLIKEADRHPEQAAEILNIAFRQGVYVTSQLQASNNGFYNIFKLRDVMADAGLSDSKRFDSLLCRLRDEEQVQLHTGDVTVHTPEENEKGFTDENGYRMGTFTLSRAPEAFRATEESLMRVLPRPRNICGQELKHEITEGDIVALKLSENPKVHLKPYTKGSFFDGEIAHVDKERGYCVQKAGNSLTVHRLEALETVPEVGEKVRITYPKDEGRKAGVAIREQRQRCHRIA